MISNDLFSIRSSKYDLFFYLRSDSVTEMKNLPKICLARIVWICNSIVSGAYVVFGMHKFGAFPGSSFSNFSSMQGFYLHSSKILGYLPVPRFELIGRHSVNSNEPTQVTQTAELCVM